MNAKIKKAMDIVGGAVKLAEMTGKSLPAVYSYLYETRKVPPATCVAIERATGGLVSRKSLRPHDWKDIWPELIKEVRRE